MFFLFFLASPLVNCDKLTQYGNDPLVLPRRKASEKPDEVSREGTERENVWDCSGLRFGLELGCDAVFLLCRTTLVAEVCRTQQVGGAQKNIVAVNEDVPHTHPLPRCCEEAMGTIQLFREVVTGVQV